MPAVADLPLYDSVMPNQDELSLKARRIEETLAAFKVEATVREINPGPAVTQFALEPGAGVKVRRDHGAAERPGAGPGRAAIAIEAPVPGMPRVGIEIPNKTIATVGLRETMESKEFQRSKAKLPIALGRDVNGRYVVADLAQDAAPADRRRDRVRQVGLHQRDHLHLPADAARRTSCSW